MIIKQKKIENPRFQLIETQGSLFTISVAEGKTKHATTYLVESNELVLKADEVTVTICVNEQRDAINEVVFDVQNKVTTIGKIENLTDCLELLKVLQLEQYWKDQNIQLLLYTVFRFIICIISSQKLEITQKANDELLDDLVKAISIQKQLINLMLFMFESFNIKSSSYVVTKRAEYLLRVGLDPKEQYENKTVLLSCRQILKLLHPDMPTGSTEFFKMIVEVQKYFK